MIKKRGRPRKEKTVIVQFRLPKSKFVALPGRQKNLTAQEIIMNYLEVSNAEECVNAGETRL